MSLRNAAREVVADSARGNVYGSMGELRENLRPVSVALIEALQRELSLSIEIEHARVQALEDAAKICDEGEEHYQDDFAKSVCIRMADLIRKLEEK